MSASITGNKVNVLLSSRGDVAVSFHSPIIEVGVFPLDGEHVIRIVDAAGNAEQRFFPTYEMAVAMAKGINDALALAGPRDVVRNNQIDLEDAIAGTV